MAVRSGKGSSYLGWEQSSADQQHSEAVVVPVAEAAGDAEVELDQTVDGYLELEAVWRSHVVGDMSLTCECDWWIWPRWSPRVAASLVRRAWFSRRSSVTS